MMEPAAKNAQIPSYIIDVWQRIVDSISLALSVPSVMINRVGPLELEVFRSNTGPANPFPAGTRMPLLGVYCAATAGARRRLRVEDARNDPVWADSPTAKAGIFAYLGYPLLWPDGDMFGTICAVDTKANTWVTPSDTLLQAVKSAVEAHLALVVATEELENAKKKMEQSETERMRTSKHLDENVTLKDLFGLTDLQRLQDLFAAAWGVGALITHPDGTPVTRVSNFSCLCRNLVRKSAKGLKHCWDFNSIIGQHNPSGPVIDHCPYTGFLNAGASITVGGRHIGNWLIGQVRNEAQTEECAAGYARRLGTDEGVFVDAFRKVPVMAQDKFSQIARALFAVANQLSIVAYQNIRQKKLIIEREKAEEALRENEERLLGITADMPGAIIRNASEKINAVIGVVRDITERKHIEKAHRKPEQEPSQSRKMDAIGQLAGGAAHDFNNILMGIQGNVSLIQMAYPPSDHRIQHTRTRLHIRHPSPLVRKVRLRQRTRQKTPGSSEGSGSVLLCCLLHRLIPPGHPAFPRV
jgi:ligand-binding sensor protein